MNGLTSGSSRVSLKKCDVIFVGNCDIQAELYLGDYPLGTSTTVRDLGILVYSEIKFGRHINHIVARAHARANLIHKCFVSKDVNALMRAFVTYVRPIVERASCVWSPCNITAAKKIEAVLRRFTKRLPSLNKLSYHERLSSLRLDSLEI